MSKKNKTKDIPKKIIKPGLLRQLFSITLLTLLTLQNMLILSPGAALAETPPMLIPGNNSTVFINEFHYDNDGTDTNEFVEIAAPVGTNLTGWSIIFYNGSGGASYAAQNLSGTVPDQPGGYGFVTVDQSGFQNGSPDGLALINNSNNVVQFLCYEGVFAATNGPANGMTCTDTGVEETSTTPTGFSLQLQGTGSVYGDFTWTAPKQNTKGTINTGQTFGGGGTPTPTTTPTATPTPTPTPTPGATTLVISQVYGGGGNSGAQFSNDFIELFNNGTSAVSFTDWSVQYASASGTSWQKAAISGTVLPGQYFLVQLGGGTSGGVALANPDASGGLNLSATSGKVALVKNNTALAGGCPLGDAAIADLVGYGGASCFEGSAPAPGLSNTTAAFRTRGGCRDTNFNQANFTEAAPDPRNSSTPLNSCPVGDPAPEVFSTTPVSGAVSVLYNSNIQINFDEPVNVTGDWFTISCSLSGLHPAVFTNNADTSFTLDPADDFVSGEVCTVTVLASQVNDIDADDPPDNMEADFVFSFQTAISRNPDVHLTMGNPSNATTDAANDTNYLIKKPEYALSYNRERGTPNWTSWQLDSTWLGSARRQNDFRPDDTLPSGFYRVTQFDYSGSGFDRGHMTPSADRTASIAENSATFLMTNMVPQSPDNNQGPWAVLENDIRSFLNGTQNEIYVISGGTGVGGTGSNGYMETIAGGNVTVPAYTWKVFLILPSGDNDVSRVTGETRTIAVIMPNVQGIRTDNWRKYLTTVDDVEIQTGYDFFSNVPVDIQAVIESRLDSDSNSAPVAEGQVVSVNEDGSIEITLAATDANVNNKLTYTINGDPQHGTLSGEGNIYTYTPDADYNGPDGFTFKASDGTADSNTASVSITVTEVNDAPTAGDDSKVMNENTTLVLAASDLTANDTAGAANESAQTLTVTQVIATGNTNGSVFLQNGQISYQPNPDYTGVASFDYEVCDNGTTNGVADSKCATATVQVTVNNVNQAPVLPAISDKTVYVGSTLNFTATAADADLPNDTLTYSFVGSVPGGLVINGATGEISWTPTIAQAGQVYSVTVRVTDAEGLFSEQTFNIGVAYTWSGLLPPIKPGGNSSFNQGSTVPVNFSLTGASANAGNVTARLYIAPVVLGVVGAEMPAESTSKGDGNLFSLTGNHYSFQLNTKELPAGTYRLRVDLGDGVSRTELITLTGSG
ncbi:MAG: DNA/RNA non-specific endonuclease [Aridibacter sp.]